MLRGQGHTADGSALDLLSGDTAIAPALWELEKSNVLLLSERRGRLSQARAARLAALLSQLPILCDRAGDDVSTVLAAGRQHALTAYDAAYLVLAQREGMPLATLDGRLRTAAQSAGVPLIPATDQRHGAGAG